MDNHDTRRKLNGAFPIVCIGMSSGAVSPVKTLFRHLAPTTGMAFVVLLPTISIRFPRARDPLALRGNARRTSVRRSAPQPNHIYVLPSGDEMATSDGFFSVRPSSKLTGWKNVFTVFLDSLSHSRHPGIAVVLSGLDRDGASALKSFKKNGGITIVQSLESAERPEMPRAAIQTG